MKRAFSLGRSGDRDISLSDVVRAEHIHVLGAPGSGKSKFLEYAIRQDILTGRGLCLLDPHGYLYADLVRWCAGRDLLDRAPVFLFDLADPAWACGFNPLNFSTLDANQIAPAVDAMISACAQVWGGEDSHRTPLLRRCLRAIFSALIEKNLTLLEAIDLMNSVDSDGVREFITTNLRDPMIRQQWAEFNAMGRRDFQETFASTNNRLVEFFHSPLIRRALGTQHCSIDFRGAMDAGHIILANLGGEGLSRASSQLLGALLVNDVFLKAFGRQPGSRPFTLYIDECHRFLNDDISGILTESRKFGLNLVLAHQNLGQLAAAGPEIESAVLGAGTKMIFGLNNPEDAIRMSASIFHGEFDYQRPKARFDRPTVVGYEIGKLRSRSASVTNGVSEGETETETEGWSESESTTDHEDATSDTSGGALTGSTARASNYVKTHSETIGSGEAEALIPKYRVLPTQSYSLEELRDIASARLLGLPRAIAIAKTRDRPSVEVRIPTIEEGLADDARIMKYREAVLSQSPFSAPAEQIEAEIEERTLELRRKASEQSTASEPRRYRG